MTARPHFHHIRIVARSIAARPVLAWSFVAGFGAAFLPSLLIPHMPLLERMLGGWCLSVIIFVVAVSYRLTMMEPDDLSRHVDDLDEGALTILAVSMGAAAASFGGVVFELEAIHGHNAGVLSLPLMVGTIVCSWFFIHVIFAIHYAHVYYNDGKRHDKPCLDFGGDEAMPDYWDFVYFSVAIGASSATSDTNLRSRAMRRVVTAHAIFSFFFNATVLALAINIAAGLLGGN